MVLGTKDNNNLLINGGITRIINRKQTVLDSEYIRHFKVHVPTGGSFAG